MHRFRFYLEYALVKILSLFMRVMPGRWTAALARFLGRLAFRLYRSRRKIALENLELACGGRMSREAMEAIGRKSFEHAAMAMTELLLVDRMLPRAASHFRLKGIEHLEGALSEGKGTILVISHLGSWELLSFLPFLTGHPWAVVVKNIRNPLINDLIDRQRRKMHVVPIPKKGSIRSVLQELKANQGVAILIDQWAGPEGLWIDFFGRPTSTTSVPARLARRTGARLIPAYCIREGLDQYEIQIHEPYTVSKGDPEEERVVTEKLNLLLEAQIMKYPEQWAWGHRRWKPKPRVLRRPEKSVV